MICYRNPVKAMLAALLVLSSVAPLHAGGRPVYDVQGQISDSSGWPMNGLYLLDFELRTGGSESPVIWSEQQYVTVKDGVYRASLGKLTSLPDVSGRRTHITARSPVAEFWGLSEIKVLSFDGEWSPASKPAAKPKPKKAASHPKKISRPAKRSKAPVAAAPKKLPRPSRYTVGRGETLPSIAEKIYGTRSRWRDLYEANKLTLDRGGMVREGQNLIIP